MKDSKKMVKQETMLIVVFITLVIGFTLGVVFAVYKLDSIPGSTQTKAGTDNNQGNLTQEQDQALRKMQELLSKDPKNFQAWIQLGHLYFDTNQPEKAISAYNESLKLHDGSADLLTDLGVMYRRVKQFDKAIEMFDKAISMDKSHVPSRLNRGIVFMYDLGKNQEAIQAWEELLTIDPNAKTANGTTVAEFLDHVKKNLATQETKK